MPKRQIEVCIESETKDKYKTTAIIKEDSISYKEKDNTLVTFNIKDNVLIRKNKEIEMNYIFSKDKETTGTIKLLDINKLLEIGIKTKELIKEEDLIKVIYTIENKRFTYTIKLLNNK